MGSVTIDIGCV